MPQKARLKPSGNMTSDQLEKISEKYGALPVRDRTMSPIKLRENYLRRAVYEFGIWCCDHKQLVWLEAASKSRADARRPTVDANPFWWVLLALAHRGMALSRHSIRTIALDLADARKKRVEPDLVVGYLLQWGRVSVADRKLKSTLRRELKRRPTNPL